MSNIYNALMTRLKTLNLNVRIEEHFEAAIDQKRIALAGELGFIPSRSDVIRYALEQYLGLGGVKAQAAKGGRGK